jgi:hypothetical protein
MITADLAIAAAVALVSASIVLTVSALMSLRRFEKLYVMQMQTMTEIIYAIAASRDDYDDDDPTDEEEHPRPELAPVIPFRGGPDGKPDDPA